MSKCSSYPNLNKSQKVTANLKKFKSRITMEKENNTAPKKSHDNGTEDFSASINSPDSNGRNEKEDISVLINSVLEKLSNIAQQTANAQQNMESIENQINTEKEENNAPPESKDGKVTEDISALINSTESTDNSASPGSSNNKGIEKSTSALIHSLEPDHSNELPGSYDGNGTVYISGLNSTESNDNNVPQESKDTEEPPASIKSSESSNIPEFITNWTDYFLALIGTPAQNPNNGIEEIAALFNSVVEKLNNIAEQTTKAQEEMENMKNLFKNLEEDDDNDNSDPDMPEAGAKEPPSPMPDFQDLKPDDSNEPRPGLYWDNDNLSKNELNYKMLNYHRVYVKAS